MTQEGVLVTTAGLFDGKSPDTVGKVRDTYIIPDVGRLIVTTDRLSAFDVVMAQGIPGKGSVLNQMTLLWMNKLESAKINHLITACVNRYPEPFCNYRDVLDGRSMLVSDLRILPIECVVRGYLAGSGLKEYRQSGTVCGIKLPADLKEADWLGEPIFTPAIKAESGHDDNVTSEQAVRHLEEKLGISQGVALALFSQMKARSIAIYEEGSRYARERGIIIADTKFEFGIRPGEITANAILYLADEILTPDSSRFWDRGIYQPGRSQDSFDKQPVRDYLEALAKNNQWNKEPPPPDLPETLIDQTGVRYRDISSRLAANISGPPI